MKSALVLALAVITAARAQSPDVAALLDHRIIDANLPLEEVRAYCEAKVPAMPAVKTLAEWEKLAQEARRDAFDKVYFRGALARYWREAKTKVEWIDTIKGGPGYHIKKVRYEALPGLWIPALLYQPDGITGKIPVHLALNGHDYEHGNAGPGQQLRCINLAKRGVASLNVEWINMRQLHADGFSHYRLNQLDLCGVSGLAPFYLAMSRGIDLLLALPYADPKRVAVSGLSGGGWQTITISALDPRVTLCNPVAGYSSFKTRARFPSDLGDSEQTPNDLATVADYTHLTAMLAGRAALLTFNAKDNCCFATDHALQPLLDAAEPIFKLYGQPERLRSHNNFDPGTHNYDVDNRQVFYRMVGDIFFPGDARFVATETPFDAEVKPEADLEVRLPADNLDLHQFAVGASKDLPRWAAPRETLVDIVKYKEHAIVAQRAGEETRGEVKAVFWKLRVGETWTVPVVELVRGDAKGTTIVVADGGRKSAAAQIEALLAAGQRVLAVDPFYFGESKIAQRDMLYALLVAAVGDRPLGIQASQVAAVARWAAEEFKSPAALESIGPRSSVFTLIATALEPRIGSLKQTDPLGSLHDVIRENWSVDQKPELFCFGLLESFDVPQLRRLVGAARLR
ncbi:MAG: hypothetical protein ABMA13_19545 [Chthoniobacteraceae bacterium]